MASMTETKKSKKSIINQSDIDDGLLMSIKDQKENWSECTLEDGTRLRIRPVITEVRKLKNLGADGKPIYGIKSALITDIQHTEKPKKGE